MTHAPALPENQKLSVIYRVEPGCLGPEGAKLVDGFCEFAAPQFTSLHSNYIVWHIIPRSDKTLPEMQYAIAKKRLSHDQAEQYLKVFGQSLDDFEGNLSDKLTTLINDFMGH